LLRGDRHRPATLPCRVFCELMASAPRSQEREEQRGLNVRTLVIASVASATAALITSQLWIAGTWIAAAITPVIVAIVSELLNRPTERIARSVTSDSTALLAEAAGAAPPPPANADRLPERAPAEPGSEREPAPVRVYRQPPSPARRRLALGVVAATAALAFLVAVAVITVPELIAGQSIGKGDGRTSLFGGNRERTPESRQPAPTDTTREEPGQDREEPPPQDTQPQDTQPQDTQPKEQPTETTTEPQPTETTTSPTTTQP
jgi:hypothetical protein